MLGRTPLRLAHVRKTLERLGLELTQALAQYPEPDRVLGGREKYCHKGGMDLGPPSGVGSPGVQMAMMAPTHGP